jgi:PIN domain nuclease of toxin-antitoxin system
VKLLLDTVTFLWILEDSTELSAAVRRELRESENMFYLSAASAWEISIKYALGKLPLPIPPRELIPSQRDTRGILALPIDEASTLRLDTLPALHRDPFDRIIVCQAIEHAMTVVTPDERIASYPVRVFW